MAPNTEKVSQGDVLQVINLQVARLGLIVDNRQAKINLALPLCHKKFLQSVADPQTVLFKKKSEGQKLGGDALLLKIIDQERPHLAKSNTKLYQSTSWELYQQENGSYLLTSSHHFPSRQIILDDNFENGLIIDDFSSTDQSACYPLEYLDIRLFQLWLATFGDLILHASGAVIGDRGYGFLGHSGAGKSTLAAALLKNHSLEILGEDQIILRYINSDFWIFGTPWHQDSSLCSPKGVKLEKLFFLNKDEKSGLRDLTPLTGVAHILQTAFIPFHLREAMPLVLEHLSLLSEKIPFYSMSYQLGSDPLELIL